jgi:hypothetical protein
VEPLTQSIQNNGGVPVQLPHLPTGAGWPCRRWARWATTGPCWLTFKANEAQVRDKYRRHAARPRGTAVGVILRAAAADAERHYEWVQDALERLGIERSGLIDTVRGAVGTVHSRAADAIESAGRRVAEAAERMRRAGRREGSGLKERVTTGRRGGAETSLSPPWSPHPP